jgi:acetyl/propionyl-CoA carboxylase alpha subunit
MIKALDDYVILGVQTSVRFLRDMIGHPQFRRGETTTSFIQDHFADWTGEKDPSESHRLALLAAAFDSMQGSTARKGFQTEKKEIYSPWFLLGKWRLGGK